ncbi:MAG: hypothetical protein LBF40_01625 [Deltaproteobacteria bacterium]|jgi:hypothetical protein|nr:hypothetical protein [Deltaproteobacteria bacterium]
MGIAMRHMQAIAVGLNLSNLAIGKSNDWKKFYKNCVGFEFFCRTISMVRSLAALSQSPGFAVVCRLFGNRQGNNGHHGLARGAIGRRSALAKEKKVPRECWGFARFGEGKTQNTKKQRENPNRVNGVPGNCQGRMAFAHGFGSQRKPTGIGARHSG